MHYPLFYIPEDLQQLLNYDLEDLKSEWKKKNYNPPTEPPYVWFPVSPDLPYKNLFLALFGVAAWGLFLWIVLIKYPKHLWSFFGRVVDAIGTLPVIISGLLSMFMIIGLLWVSWMIILLSYYLIVYLGQSVENIFSYPSKVKRHNLAYLEYQRLKQEYEVKHKRYLIEKASYDRSYSRKVNKQYLISEHYKQANIIIKKKMSSSYNLPCTAEVKVKMGKSERTFLRLLKKHVPKEIEIFENQTLNHVFYPDITLKFPNGVFCDIEIDEPYCEEDKQPIHCLDFDTNCHADEERTDYFLKHDWCVIRFAEEQIVQYPLSCIKYVLQVVDYFFSSNNYSTLLETIDDLELVECWDTAKAQQLAEQDHRLNYLNR